MKKLLFFLLGILLFSFCEKEKCLSCEINQTFTLVFKNYNGYVSYLCIGNQNYFVKDYKEKLYLKVPVQSASLVHVIHRKKYIGKDTKPYYKDTVEYMAGRPNACATYNYFW